MPSTNLTNLLRVAAEMRANGMSWKEIAKKVHRSDKTVCQWPRQFKKHWAATYEEAARSLFAEAGSESLMILRSNLRSDHEATQLKAAALLLKHFPHRKPYFGLGEPDGERDWEVGLTNRARFYEKVKAELTAENEEEGLPAPTREDVLHEMRTRVKFGDVDPADHQPAPKPAKAETGSLLSQISTLLAGGVGAALMLVAFLLGQSSNRPSQEAWAVRGADRINASHRSAMSLGLPSVEGEEQGLGNCGSGRVTMASARSSHSFMAKQSERTVLFLCTGNYYRSRYAEILFNSVVTKMGLPWRATSRALALELGVLNVGPIAQGTLKALEKDRLHTHPDCRRMPIQATEADFAGAHRIVAVKKDEHLPYLVERFPNWADKVEFWHVDDAPGTLEIIEREVMALAARLITGAARPDVIQLEIPPEPPPPPEKAKPAPIVKVGRETKGRGGKGVTIVSEIPLGEAGLKDLAAKLKQRCGTGGTVKDGHIEIQGDQRDRVTLELEKLGFRVKRSGG